ncbi:mannose-6-phosphate isomerase, class I [Vibrio ostreicida]|uniref:mannose-6-phosphate isomerase n=1 Tax=Vibrio ostreicida TaxID=526588 RepID=A0ABT8BTE5_9VIBR|nr:mannose-6-phosphate isomerase, class I [Vibrio ostreicida]MDN3609651.1 mannose-6-phosphate isomerase, class I [Vibrio ostreicida]NPD09517.1 mannose-6-phosphate isomerase, class I [Vibrio ostreicida]
MSDSTAFFLLENVIQRYPWGSRDSIQSLFGIDNPEQQPQAEIWMGAHPNGCSKIQLGDQSLSLADYIDHDPASVLSPETHQQFGELPFLFKVLAAQQALSIQVHPSKSQAEIGFAHEEKAGIERCAANRNYKDPNHKPELVYALTPYLAMNGFRSFEAIIALFERLKSQALAADLDAFKHNPSSLGLQHFFKAMLELKGEKKANALEDLLQWAQKESQPLGPLILSLNEQYPDDVGLLAPLMLNVLELQPGEAMFLDAGTPHAYIKGTALEIMANSDNVLRAGLTPKYMDIDELIGCCKFEALDDAHILTAPVTKDEELNFPVPVDDFRFSVLHQPQQRLCSLSRAEIWFAIDQDVILQANNQILTLRKGESAFVPFSTKNMTVTSTGSVARAH